MFSFGEGNALRSVLFFKTCFSSAFLCLHWGEFRILLEIDGIYFKWMCYRILGEGCGNG